MADDIERDLRRLAKRFKITFRTTSIPQQWPPEHQSSFQSIRKIGDQKLVGFSANIDIRSNDEPWKERTKYRAEWLTKRAARLFDQQRNEPGWRFGLENDVFRRFSVEVACPKCRARIWRSEIEVCISQSNDVGNLEERRKSRKPCTCSPKDRPQDFYEIGTNPLFDDRAEEVIIHDLLLRSQLPKQKPDRVYGLQATSNFQKLLSSSLPRIMGHDSDLTLRGLVKSCPFKDDEVEPLLFPFLILEAKSAKSRNGFHDIQTQTAFPILALLKLQQDLLAQVPDGHRAERPLVWFFANRGDTWQVYGCCLSSGTPTGYDIFLLWHGSILFEDSSLQLLLIVDYIFDWARDIYRPSILRQLKSIVIGSTFDQVSLTDDSDIMSLRRDISNWIQPPPSTITGLDFGQDMLESVAIPVINHQSLLPLLIPNTQFGTVHSAALVESRVEAIYITEHNVRQLLQPAAGGEKYAARQLLNFLAKWNELFLFTGGDLDHLEEIWTGQVRTTDEFSTRSTNSIFYVLVEARIFMSISWNIIREVTYLAVSEAAFEIIVNCAAFKIKHAGKQIVEKIGRSCSREILTETLNCLLSGSPSQLFIAATACTSLSVYSLPEQKRVDYVPPIEALGFGPIRRPRLLHFIQKFSRPTRKRDGRTLTFQRSLLTGSAELRKNLLTKRQLQNLVPKQGDMTHIRVSERTERTSEIDSHEESQCFRCLHSSKHEEKQHHLTLPNHDVFSAYGLNIVVSLSLTGDGADRNDVCLFAVENVPELIGDVELGVIVEDLLQSGHVHHTIRHTIPSKFEINVLARDTIWNLPLSYRPMTSKERIDITDWANELKGYPTLVLENQKNPEDRWDRLQLLLHWLGNGKTFAEADSQVNLNEQSTKTGGRSSVYNELNWEVDRRRAKGIRDDVPRPVTHMGPPAESTREDRAVYPTFDY